MKIKLVLLVLLTYKNRNMYQINTNPRAKNSDTHEYARIKIKLALPILSYKNKNMQQINTNPRAQNSDTLE